MMLIAYDVDRLDRLNLSTEDFYAGKLMNLTKNGTVLE